MTQEAARVSAVTLLLGDEVRELLLLPDLPLSELLQCIAAGFPTAKKPPVALKHASNHVFYPLSLLCRSPELFEDAKFYLVLDGEQADAGRKNKQRHRAHHSRKRGSRARDTPDKREYQAVTTTSEANEDDEDVDDFEEKQTPQISSGDELDIDLTDFELPQLANVFIQACPTGALDRATFNRCLEKILSQSGRYDPLARKMFTRLFNIFERQSMRRDIVDVADFLGGVSVFACGERDEKILLTFDLYDMDDDGFISKEEMIKYLTAVFLVIGEASPELFQQNNVNPVELGIVTANQCFAESTLNREGKLSYDAFQEWYSKPGPTHLVSATRGKNGSNTNGQALGHIDLTSLREITGLSALSASDLFSIFSAASTSSGDMQEALSRAVFKRCFHGILERLNRKPTKEIVT
eukprot:jgi/Phyca11/532695/estExt2_fgenesh1_pg.C_PHYCAscaffold_70114